MGKKDKKNGESVIVLYDKSGQPREEKRRNRDGRYKRMQRKMNDPPVFTLCSDAELLDLALDGGERFSSDAKVEELCFDELI